MVEKLRRFPTTRRAAGFRVSGGFRPEDPRHRQARPGYERRQAHRSGDQAPRPYRRRNRPQPVRRVRDRSGAAAQRKAQRWFHGDHRVDDPRLRQRRSSARRSRWAPTTRSCFPTTPSAGATCWGTAVALAAGIKAQNPDLVITGTQSTDAISGDLPGMLAEKLGYPGPDVRAQAGGRRRPRARAARDRDRLHDDLRGPAGGREHHEIRQRAALSVAQRHHGRQEKGDQAARRRRSRA